MHCGSSIDTGVVVPANAAAPIRGRRSVREHRAAARVWHSGRAVELPIITRMRENSSSRGPSVRSALVALLVAACLFAGGAAAGRAASSGLPNPCLAVPNTVIASAFGLRAAPASVLTSLPNLSTCSYARGELTVAVGFTALGNPLPPEHVTSVGALPSGRYETFAGTTQTELVFIEGSAKTGLYGVLRNFARIPEAKLIKVAQALIKGMGPAGANASGGGRTLLP
jgi:hypothetical protein